MKAASLVAIGPLEARVEEGHSRLFAAGDVDSGGVDDAEYVKPWLSRAVSLKLGAKERPASDLKLQ
jgi:hypothetical protein